MLRISLATTSRGSQVQKATGSSLRAVETAPFATESLLQGMLRPSLGRHKVSEALLLHLPTFSSAFVSVRSFCGTLRPPQLTSLRPFIALGVDASPW